MLAWLLWGVAFVIVAALTLWLALEDERRVTRCVRRSGTDRPGVPRHG